MKNTYQIFKAKDGWRWRLKSSNGRILADSGEAYQRKSGLMKTLNSILTKPYTIQA